MTYNKMHCVSLQLLQYPPKSLKPQVGHRLIILSAIQVLLSIKMLFRLWPSTVASWHIRITTAPIALHPSTRDCQHTTVLTETHQKMNTLLMLMVCWAVLSHRQGAEKAASPGSPSSSSSAWEFCPRDESLPAHSAAPATGWGPGWQQRQCCCCHPSAHHPRHHLNSPNPDHQAQQQQQQQQQHDVNVLQQPAELMVLSSRDDDVP
jgi:hypothetical protein